MPRKQYTYHYIYKTTCLVTNKFYIGMHSTSNLKDGYLGSGKRLWYSLNKHGKENHQLEILEFCLDRISLKNREKEIVNEDFLKNELCMNLQMGGTGGFINAEHQFKCSSAGGKIGGKIAGPMNLKYMIAGRKRKIQNGTLLISGKNGSFYGKHHTEETKHIIGMKNSIHQQGNNHSQYGTHWIYSLTEKKSVKIKKEELNDWLEKGWIKGRKMKL